MKNQPSLLSQFSVICLAICLLIVSNSQAFKSFRLLVLVIHLYRKELDMRYIGNIFNFGINTLDSYNQLVERTCNLLFFGEFELTSPIKG